MFPPVSIASWFHSDPRYALFSAFSLSSTAGVRTSVHSDPSAKSPLARNWCIQTLTNVMHLALLIGHAISFIIRCSFTCICETAWLQTAAQRPKFYYCCCCCCCCWQTDWSALAAMRTVFKRHLLMQLHALWNRISSAAEPLVRQQHKLHRCCCCWQANLYNAAAAALWASSSSRPWTRHRKERLLAYLLPPNLGSATQVCQPKCYNKDFFRRSTNNGNQYWICIKICFPDHKHQSQYVLRQNRFEYQLMCGTSDLSERSCYRTFRGRLKKTYTGSYEQFRRSETKIVVSSWTPSVRATVSGKTWRLQKTGLLAN